VTSLLVLFAHEGISRWSPRYVLLFCNFYEFTLPKAMHAPILLVLGLPACRGRSSIYGSFLILFLLFFDSWTPYPGLEANHLPVATSTLGKLKLPRPALFPDFFPSGEVQSDVFPRKETLAHLIRGSSSLLIFFLESPPSSKKHP